MGKVCFSAGREGELASIDLANQFKALDFKTTRFNTSTPPRLHRRSIDFSELKAQESAGEPLAFSFESEKKTYRKHKVYITRTTPDTQRVIEEYLPQVSLLSKSIDSTAARYCPTIEDKIVRFPIMPLTNYSWSRRVLPVKKSIYRAFYQPAFCSPTESPTHHPWAGTL